MPGPPGPGRGIYSARAAHFSGMAHLKFTMVCSPLVASKRGPLLMLLLPLYIWSKLQPIGAQDRYVMRVHAHGQRFM